MGLSLNLYPYHIAAFYSICNNWPLFLILILYLKFYNDMHKAPYYKDDDSRLLIFYHVSFLIPFSSFHQADDSIQMLPLLRYLLLMHRLPRHH